jgi:arylsulfatase A-like enzyme
MPLIIAGPGIKSSQVISTPAQLDDVAPTVLRVMGVNPTGMQGDVLTDALSNPTSADAQRRDVEIKQLQPVVSSLIAESQPR